ncbi:MAG: hypothetical protein ABSH37_17545 [Bryobacteraceae bacterium]|jgi:hypothetical protein
MRWFVIVLLAAVTAFAADDPWTKVRDLKSGTELRIFKKGGMHPILAKMEQANPDSLIIVLKNEELAIPRDQIDRIDYRPLRTGGRVTKETRETVEPADAKTAAESPNNVPGETVSSGTSYAINPQPDFQTIYRRPPPEAKK